MEKADDGKLAFLKQALSEGAHEKVPPGLTPDQWVRWRNIGGVYSGSSTTYEELGERYGVTRERIRQLNKSFLERLWENCSLDTQKQFPLDEIPFRKPVTLRVRERMSQVKGGASSKIFTQFRLGVTDLGEILRITQVSKREAYNCRKTLKEWGFTLQRTTFSYEDIERKIHEEEGNKKLQGVLDSMPAVSIYSFMQRHRPTEQRQQQPIFISLGNMLHEAGYHPKLDRLYLFAEALKAAGVPIRKAIFSATRRREKEYPRSSYILLNKRKTEALEVVNNTPSLQHFRKT